MGKERIQAFPPKVAIQEHWVSREVQITAAACCKQVPVWVLVKQKPWQYFLQGHKTAEALMLPVRGTKLVQPLRKCFDCVPQKQLSSCHLTHKPTPTRLPPQTELYIPREKGKGKKILDTFCPNRFVVKTWNPPDFHQMKDKLIAVYLYFL